MTTADRAYGGVSAAARQGARRQLLIDGVLDVVGDRGVLGVTVDAVCGAAGLTKRYFYESFDKLDDALVAALEVAFVALRDRVATAIANVEPPAERARTVVHILIDTLATDPRVARLYVEAPGHGALRARREVAIAEFTSLLHIGSAPTGRSERALDAGQLALRLVVAGTTDLVTAWLGGVVLAEREAVVDTIVAAALSAVGDPPRDP